MFFYDTPLLSYSEKDTCTRHCLTGGEKETGCLDGGCTVEEKEESVDPRLLPWGGQQVNRVKQWTGGELQGPQPPERKKGVPISRNSDLP